MAFSFLYVAVRAVLGALVRSRRGLDVKDIELLVLRHELAILRRQVVRPKLGMADRALWPLRLFMWRDRNGPPCFVSPRTLLRWHRALSPVTSSKRPDPMNENAIQGPSSASLDVVERS